MSNLSKNKFIALMFVILLVVMLATGCASSALAKTGDTVRVHYTGELADGTVFDTSVGGEPLEFTIGQGKVIDSFEQAVIGMQVGDNKTITIPADQAYGQRSDDMIFDVAREDLPASIEPEVGMQLQMNQGDGSIMIVTITDVSETTVKIDANHPLAGKDLTFDIKLVGIGKPRSSPAASSISSMPLGQALSSGKPTIAEFGSSTCVPCKQMKTIFEKLVVEYHDKLNVVIIEVYEQMELTRQYGIMVIPTQIIFDSNGKEITRHTGVWPSEDIIAQFKKMGVE